MHSMSLTLGALIKLNRVNLTDATSLEERARSVHPHYIEAVCDLLLQLLDAEVIHKSEPPFFSLTVVIRKKNSDVRLCIDNGKLNLQTVKDSYAIPNLKEFFSALMWRWSGCVLCKKLCACGCPFRILQRH